MRSPTAIHPGPHPWVVGGRSETDGKGVAAMKPKNRKEKLYRRIADFVKNMEPKMRFDGMYHKPGSNKK